MFRICFSPFRLSRYAHGHTRRWGGGLLLGMTMLFLSACQSVPTTRISPPPTSEAQATPAVKLVESANEPATAATHPPSRPPAAVKPKIAPTPTPTPTPTPSAASAAVLSQGEFAMLVESTPAGAMVALNGVPIGRTPRRIVLPVTAQGFSRGTVSIKARFVAEDSSQTSTTIEEELTPLDKLPTTLIFTPDRVQRKM